MSRISRLRALVSPIYPKFQTSWQTRFLEAGISRKRYKSSSPFIIFSYYIKRILFDSLHLGDRSRNKIWLQRDTLSLSFLHENFVIFESINFIRLSNIWTFRIVIYIEFGIFSKKHIVCINFYSLITCAHDKFLR